MKKAGERKAADESFELCLQLPPLLRSYSESYLKALAEKTRAYDGLIDGFLAGSLTGDVLGKGDIP